MPQHKITKIDTITEGHRMMGLPSPKHPLISVVNYADLPKEMHGAPNDGYLLKFFMISLKKDVCNKLIYGQQEYDFDEGILYFLGPNQIVRGAGSNVIDEPSGWILFIHPDLFFGTSMVKKIKSYEFFDYSVSEALFLSESEEETLNGIINNLQTEYQANIDPYSQDIIISHIETLLNYSERFYQRQFITRKKSNHKILTQLNDLLENYFTNEDISRLGLPTVQYVSELLNVSPSYLGSLLKTLTGQSTQQHIHEKLISKAKEQLSTTTLSVGEIAYALGFEHTQSFSKLFKNKTKQTPLEFRASFN